MRTLSLKWRAVLGVTALTVLVLLTVSAVQLRFMHRDLARVLADQQFALVSRLAQEIDAKFDNYADVLTRSAATLPPELFDSPAALREYYRTRPGLFALFDDVLLLDAGGRVLADYPEVPGRTSVVVSPAYVQRVIAARKPVIDGPLRGRASGEPLVRIDVPIFGADGRVRGVLEGVLRLYKRNFLASLGNSKVGKSGYFLVLAKETAPRYVIHPERTKILTGPKPGVSFSIDRALTGADGSSEDTGGSLPALYSYKSLSSINWVLIAAVPAAEAYSPVVEAERRLWLLGALTCLLMIPLVWGMAWLILRPVAGLRDGIDKLRGGGRGYRPVPVERRDEIGDLTRSFNALMRERAVAEAKQRDSEERLRMITDNLPALVSYLGTDLRYRFVNHTYNEWFHHTGGEFIGRTLREVMGEEGYAIVGPAAERALKGETVTYRRRLLVRGEPRIIESTLIPDFGFDGGVTGLYVLAHDISTLLHTKDELRALNLQLEERVRQRTAALALSNRELETFAYSVAHDFRAPLRAMDSFSAILLEEQSARLDDDGRDYLRRIRESSNRLAKLIDDLLRLAQLAQQELHHESVDLSALAAQVLAVLQAAEPLRRVHSMIMPGMIVTGDRTLLGTLLRELIGNAWKFTATVTEARIEVGCEIQDGTPTFYVRDNGVGFDMSFAQKVFTPFARLHGEEFTGTGIGLALARRIVDRHSGHLWAEAHDGHGAVFWFTLPN
ncbi:MAG: histidine kinase [Bradyrhizobium sp.]|nr:histidine kinase [Bradyrhizobium sp.]